MSDGTGVMCPFCGKEKDDLIGLKAHLVLALCDKLNEIELGGRDDLGKRRLRDGAVCGSPGVKLILLALRAAGLRQIEK